MKNTVLGSRTQMTMLVLVSWLDSFPRIAIWTGGCPQSEATLFYETWLLAVFVYSSIAHLLPVDLFRLSRIKAKEMLGNVVRVHADMTRYAARKMHFCCAQWL